MAYWIGYYGTSILILIGYITVAILILKGIRSLIRIKIPCSISFLKRRGATELCMSPTQQYRTNPIYIVKLYNPNHGNKARYSQTFKTDAIEIPQHKPFLSEGGEGTIINAAVVAPGELLPDEAGVEVVYAGNGSYRMKN